MKNMDSDSSSSSASSSDIKCRNEEKQLFHVLAVDDSHIDRKLLERLLTVSSYQVTCVDSGDKALEYLGLLDKFKEGKNGISPSSSSSSTTVSYESSLKPAQQEVSKINLIMTDYSMPGISGYDLLKRIKDSSWKDVPVVVMSSENVPSRIDMCIEGGAEEFLLKPVKLSDLNKIHSHLLKSDDQITTVDHNSIISCNNADSKVTINDVIINREEHENDKNCSNANKRKANLATSSDLSDRRPRVQELPVA